MISRLCMRHELYENVTTSKDSKNTTCSIITLSCFWRLFYQVASVGSLCVLAHNRPLIFQFAVLFVAELHANFLMALISNVQQ